MSSNLIGCQRPYIKWESSDETIATVDDYGVISARRGGTLYRHRHLRRCLHYSLRHLRLYGSQHGSGHEL